MRQCQACGRKLTRQMFGDVYLWRRAKYCGMRCYQKAHRVKPRPCPHCGKRFRPRTNNKQFCSVRCQYLASRRDGNRYLGCNGYWYIKARWHPASKDCRGYILEHRLIAERLLGRRLRAKESIHHCNGIKTDNRPENILVVGSTREHFGHHIRGYHGWFVKGQTT